MIHIIGESLLILVHIGRASVSTLLRKATGNALGVSTSTLMPSMWLNSWRMAPISNNFAMLEMGRTDYFMIGFYSGISWLHKQGLRSKFATRFIFEDTLIHHGFSKKSPCKAIEPAFSAKLQEYFESGKTEAALTKYEQIWLQQTVKN